jgi:hypothetical protein
MGTWGTALYSNDNASDIRDDFRAIARAPWDGARIAEYLLNRFPAGQDPGDDDYTDTHLAIADLFWQYGIKHPDVFERAAKIVDDGDDLEAKRLLGMAEADLKQRRRILEELRDKWRGPNPKPRHRRMLIAAEPFLFEAGDCLCYPTEEGRVINPYLGDRGRKGAAPYPFKPDGWGAVAVLRTFRRFDVFARYLVAVLDYNDRWKPSLEQFPSLNILHVNESMLYDNAPPSIRVYGVYTTAQHLKRMRVQTLGALEANAALVAQHFDIDAPPLSNGESDLCGVIARELDMRGNTWVDYPLRKYLK